MRIARRRACALLAATLARSGRAGAAPRAAAPDAVPARIAFGSCAHQDQPQPIWDDVLAFAPQLFLFLGDNVYGDSERPGVPELLEAYRQAKEPLGRIRARVPVMATWDDHDFGLNDAGAEYPFKAEAQAAFAAFWELPPDDPRRHRPGVYSALAFGPPGRRLQTILLDTRSFRSGLRLASGREHVGRGPYAPDPDPAKTMLGAGQWQWLEERLAEPADLRVIGSSIQVLAERHGFERWGNLPRERDRLLELVRAATGRSVLVSGDRHVGAVYQAPDGLTEITSSGINMVARIADAPEPLLRGRPYQRPNFGTLEVDWDERTVRAAVRGLGEGVVREVLVPLA